MTSEHLLTVPDVAAMLKVTEETVRAWLRKDEVSGYNFGGRTGWRIPPSELDRLLQANAGKRQPTISRVHQQPKKSGT